MNIPYQVFIALRYIKSKKRQKGISINTFISIAGVALGVMVLITVLSVMGGFHEDLQGKILGVNAHIVVLNYGGKIKDDRALYEAVNSVKGVKHSAPFIYGQVMLGFGDRAYGVVVRGIELDFDAGTTDILKYIKEGSFKNFRENKNEVPGIVVGRQLSRNLGIFTGDEVNMISPIGDIGPLGMIPKMKKFRVTGIFEAGMYEYDSNLVFVAMHDAQDFFKFQGEITGLEVKVDEIYNSPEIADKIEAVLGPPFYAKDWMEMNKNLFSALKLEKIVMFIILILIVLVASFNIISNLIMIVMEKGREIAIIRAMGATSSSIMSIFMIHGLIIGIIGTILGLGGGYLLCLLLKTYKF